MFLDKIVATKKHEVEALRNQMHVSQAEREISSMPPCLGFERAITTGRRRDLGLIAEVKKASPSKGLIRSDFDPVALASAYERAGADCLSVLTDSEYFQGSNAYLQQIRATVQRPILRKDFTIDPLQVYEARLIGADAVLLIAAILNDAQLRELLKLAKELGMDALVEVHDRTELERALALEEASLIGINNRDLRTFVTDLRTTERLMAHVPTGRTIVSESGISDLGDIGFVRDAGAKAVLIGEHFMRQQSVEAAVHSLMGAPVEA